MHGVGPPLVTPFDEDGSLNESKVPDLVTWVESQGVDFLVACGSTGEAELMTVDERIEMIEHVVDAASVPVIAGTGHPGYRETRAATRAAAAAGAHAALVVTPFYYRHGDEALEAYYRRLADTSPMPIYLYVVPKFTGVTLAVETIADLAEHDNIHGIKDSTGALDDFIRLERATRGVDFDLLIGHGGLLTQALEVGGTGGILALANVAPRAVADIVEAAADDPLRARERNAEVIELNRAVTSTYGIPGLKWAMRRRGAPAGYPRFPHPPLADAAKTRLETLVSALEAEAR